MKQLQGETGRGSHARAGGHRLAWIAPLTGAALLLSGPLALASDRFFPVGTQLGNDESAPRELDGIRIDDKAGTQLPADLRFKDQNGRDVKLGSYFDGVRPVVMVLAYYTCPMLCTVVLNGITTGLKGVAATAGDTYRVVIVSIDPRDTPAVAVEKRANYLKSYGRTVKADAWDFLTSDEKDARALAGALGFHYRWLPAENQFAHAAGAFILTPNGKVSRVLYGIQFNPDDLKLALADASGGRFARAVNQLLLFCFHYDPKAGKYVLAAQRVMTAGGVLTVFALVLMVALFLRHEKNTRGVAAWKHVPRPSGKES